jgi:hypothetical protein
MTIMYQTKRNRLLHHPINEITKLTAIFFCKSAEKIKFLVKNYNSSIKGILELI